MKIKALLLILAAIVFLNAPAFAEQEAKEEKPCMIKSMIKSLFYKASPEDVDQTGFVPAPQK